MKAIAEKDINAVKISVKDLVAPLFVAEGPGMRHKIASMPGVCRYSPDTVIGEVREMARQGIRAVLLFGVPKKKDGYGSGAYKKDSAVARAVREIKKEIPGLTVMTDVCLCAYTSHGHCGILKSRISSPVSRRSLKNRFIDNNATLEALSRMALAHAEAGADYVAPSAMAKGQVSAIRRALDDSDFKNTRIMGYSAKFASNFYGPFREAAGSSPEFGDRTSYQLSYENAEVALAEIADDIREGADIVMVKPALAYLDIICRARERFKARLAAYSVSGEYAMLKTYARAASGKARAAELEKSLVFEALSSIKRAGADLIITYHAKDMAGWLNGR